MARDERCAWEEYDMLAEYCAKHGLTGGIGTRLPDGVGADTMRLIEHDVEAFEERVRGTAYALAMEKHDFS